MDLPFKDTTIVIWNCQEFRDALFFTPVETDYGVSEATVAEPSRAGHQLQQHQALIMNVNDGCLGMISSSTMTSPFTRAIIHKLLITTCTTPSPTNLQLFSGTDLSSSYAWGCQPTIIITHKNFYEGSVLAVRLWFRTLSYHLCVLFIIIWSLLSWCIHSWTNLVFSPSFSALHLFCMNGIANVNDIHCVPLLGWGTHGSSPLRRGLRAFSWCLGDPGERSDDRVWMWRIFG